MLYALRLLDQSQNLASISDQTMSTF